MNRKDEELNIQGIQYIIVSYNQSLGLYVLRKLSNFMYIRYLKEMTQWRKKHF